MKMTKTKNKTKKPQELVLLVQFWKVKICTLYTSASNNSGEKKKICLPPHALHLHVHLKAPAQPRRKHLGITSPSAQRSNLPPPQQASEPTPLLIHQRPEGPGRMWVTANSLMLPIRREEKLNFMDIIFVKIKMYGESFEKKKTWKFNIGSTCFSFTSPCCSNIRYPNVANFSLVIGKSRVCIFNGG